MSKSSPPDDGLIGIAVFLFVLGAILAASLYGVFPWAYLASLFGGYAGMQNFWGDDPIGIFFAGVSALMIRFLEEGFSLQMTGNWLPPLLPALVCWLPATWMVVAWIRSARRANALRIQMNRSA